jgi:hypothetical protein
MSDARQAVQAATGVDAARHAPATFKLAQAHLARAELAIDFRDFAEAREESLASKRFAADARRVAVTIRNSEAALREVEGLGLPAGEAKGLLEDARAAGRAGEAEQAASLAGQSLAASRHVINEHYLERARVLLYAVEDRIGSLEPADRERYRAAESALWAQDGQRAYDLARGLPAPAASRRGAGGGR